jgi:ADP-heptose:LPS heptosyltransferase
MKLLYSIKKIGIFRALQLGDLLCTTPAMRALRYANMNAEIVLIGLPWANLFCNRFASYIDRFIHFPGYPGLPEQPFDAIAFDHFKKVMQEEEFDLLLQMQGNGTIVNAFLNKMNAKHLAGFHTNESFMNTDLFIQYPDYGHEAERHLMLMDHLGIMRQGNHLDFPLTVNDHAEFEALQLSLEYKKYVVVHPGSRGSWRQWPPKKFAMLANYCAEQGFDVVVTGTTEEKTITGELIKYLNHPALDLTGQTSLGALGLLLCNSFLLIANCTGISHMASALATPSIIISMDGEPERWRPFDRYIHRMIDWTTTPDDKLALSETQNLIRELQASFVTHH